MAERKAPRDYFYIANELRHIAEHDPDPARAADTHKIADDYERMGRSRQRIMDSQAILEKPTDRYAAHS